MAETGNSDKDLLFEMVFTQYFERIVNYVFFFCHDWEEAENIAQDTFVAYWNSMDKVKDKNSPLSYLLVTAKNSALNSLRHRQVKSRFRDFTQKRELELSYRTLESSTLEKVNFEELEGAIQKSMKRMKGIIRDTFYLSRYENKTNEEIATKLGISSKTVEYRMMVALRILRKDLKDFL